MTGWRIGYSAGPMLNRTELIFCQETVDPDLVTRTLALQPTLSYKAGEVVAVGNIKRVTSTGMWKLCLPGSQPVESVEEQLVRWLTLLQTKKECFVHLRQLGYSPYID